MRYSLMACVSVLTLATLNVSAAQAQQASNNGSLLEEVVVTARKREERLRDIPVAGTVVDVEGLEARGGVTTVDGLLSNIPSVRFLNTSSPVNSEVSIRGSGTSRGTSAEASVGLYRDGAYIGGGNLGGRSFTSLDLFDVGRVEALRGTQGALYGRNAVGGAINIVSARPTNRFEGYVDGNYAFATQKGQFQGVLNMPLSDSVAVRFGVTGVNQKKGFFYNPDNNRYFDGQKGAGVRGQIRYTGEKSTLNFLIENQVMRIPSLYYQVYILPGAVGFPKGVIQPKYEYPWNTSPTAKQNIASVSVATSFDLDWATLSTTTTYRKRKSLSSFDSDAGDVASLAATRAAGNNPPGTDPNAGAENHDETANLFGDIRLVGDKTGKFSWLAGAEWLQIESRSENWTTRTPTAANTSTGTRTPALAKTKSLAYYATLGYDITSTLNVGVEGRSTQEERSRYTQRYDRVTGVVPATARLFTFVSSKPSNTNYNVQLSYRGIPGWLAYVKTGTAFRAGGFNTDQGDIRAPKPPPPTFSDEHSKTTEVGLKGNILPNLYVAIAGYKSKIDDFLVQDDNGCIATNPVCPVTSTAFLINAGQAQTTGIEIEANTGFRIWDGTVRSTVGVAHNDSKVTSGPYRGLKIPQAPNWTGSATLNFRRPITDGMTGFVNVNYQTQSGGVQEIAGTPPLYNRVTVDLRTGITRGGTELAVYANNAANADYILFETATVRRWSVPRVYGVQLRYKW